MRHVSLQNNESFLGLQIQLFEVAIMFEILLAFTVEAYIELREDEQLKRCNATWNVESASLKNINLFWRVEAAFLWHRRVRRKRWEYLPHQTFQVERQTKDKLNHYILIQQRGHTILCKEENLPTCCACLEDKFLTLRVQQGPLWIFVVGCRGMGMHPSHVDGGWSNLDLATGGRKGKRRGG